MRLFRIERPRSYAIYPGINSHRYLIHSFTTRREASLQGCHAILYHPISHIKPATQPTTPMEIIHELSCTSIVDHLTSRKSATVCRKHTSQCRREIAQAYSQLFTCNKASRTKCDRSLSDSSPSTTRPLSRWYEMTPLRVSGP